MQFSDVPVVAAPTEWKRSSDESDSRLHQLAPYIGKLKPVIARDLVTRFSRENDLVLDCFSGSGTVPLEASNLGRRVLAFDTNPYAIALTRAKLESPSSLAEAMESLELRMTNALKRPRIELTEIPEWVRKFFHPNTLIDAVRFADECIEQDDQFLLACLLGILHHQRPGFLSYPSSHLVPYLRDKKFPRSDFPEMYDERELAPRLRAKVQRAMRRFSVGARALSHHVEKCGVDSIRIKEPVDAIITSPPYMNALDYVRDNRLRMWFLDRETANYSPEPTEKQQQFESTVSAFVRNAFRHLKRGGYCVLVVGETVLRKRITSHPAEVFLKKLCEEDGSLFPECIIADEIPDIRRSRRNASATKRELIMILRKSSDHQ